MMVINEVICVSVSTVCKAHIRGCSSPGCKFNPRHDVNNTDMFIHGQNSLPFTLAGAFNFLGSSALHPSLPQTHPSLASLRLIPEPACTTSTPTPTPVTAHPLFRYRQMESLSALASLPVSASVSHTPHCLSCLPLSYPLPSEK